MLPTNYVISSTHINTMVSLALEAHDQKNPEFLGVAIEHLDQYLLPSEQNNKIITILKNVASENVVQASLLITQVLNGETGAIVQPPLVDDAQANFHLPTNRLCQDAIQNLFNQWVSQGDLPSIGAVSCVNRHYNQATNKCWTNFSLKQCCPKGLTILDLKTMGFEGVEPKINHVEVLKSFCEIARHVEGQAGCTLLTMPEDLTLSLLVKIATDAGINIEFGWDAIQQEFGDVTVKQSYVILITNSVFMKSKNKSFAEHKELVVGHGCQMPTLQEYTALCVLTNKTFKKCLYAQYPRTLGRSSTCIGRFPLLVGGSTPVSLRLSSFHGFDDQDLGAGGRRAFRAIGS